MNNKTLSIFFFLLGDVQKASSRVRGFWILEELQKLKVKTDFGIYNKVWSLFIVGGWKSNQYNTIVFQKTFSRFHVTLAQILKWNGKLIVLDIDDYPSFNNDQNTLRNFRRMVNISHVVFVGSDNLKLLVENAGGKAVLIPTGIAIEKYRFDLNKKKISKGIVTIGWIGNAKYYSQDLVEILLPALQSVINSGLKVRLKLIGTQGQIEMKNRFSDLIGLEVHFVDSIDWGDSEKVNESLADVDIGVYPLLPKNENHYKCGFKALEYLASGIPVVSSDISINQLIVRHGETGFMASSPLEWEKYLIQLIQSEPLRLRFAEQGRYIVEKEFSTQKMTHRILRELNYAK
jgi:glycosyltransferase involved in cell wall biosynthesis